MHMGVVLKLLRQPSSKSELRASLKQVLHCVAILAQHFTELVTYHGVLDCAHLLANQVEYIGFPWIYGGG